MTNYTWCNWKVRTNFGHEFHIQKQDKMFTTTYVSYSWNNTVYTPAQFSINVWAGIAGDFSVGPHVLPHRLTGNHYRDFSFMIWQSYWKLYHCQSEHECGTCMMVLRHILAALCEMFSVTIIMTDGWMDGTHCVASTLATFEPSTHLPVGNTQNSCVWISFWQRRGISPSQCGCLSDYS
jgi:hypothetical protein